jgi:hypothetical protein
MNSDWECEKECFLAEMGASERYLDEEDCE